METPSKLCPFCRSKNTRKQSDFGTSVMATVHYCIDCNSYFEGIKWGDDDPELDLPDFLKDIRS